MADKSKYPNYDEFLRASIQRCWERSDSTRVTFLALMLASRHAWAVAIDKTISLETGKKLATGAAGVAAVGVLIRLFLGGPLGLLLTGASVVSLVAVYGKNRHVVGRKVLHYRELIRSYEPKFDKLKAVDTEIESQNLMLDGLMARFLDELDAELVEPEEPIVDAMDSASNFASHVQKREAKEADEE